MAFSRYFVVLLRVVVPVVAAQIGALELNRFGRICGLVGLLSSSWCGPVFSELDAGGGGVLNRTFLSDQSARQWVGGPLQPRSRLFNLSYRMEVEMGWISSPLAPWEEGRI